MLKERILECFYIYHEKPSDITIKFNVSKPYITKVIRKDSKYIAEKECKMLCSKEKRAIYRHYYNKKNRKSNKGLEDFIKLQHKNASLELSYEVRNHVVT